MKRILTNWALAMGVVLAFAGRGGAQPMRASVISDHERSRLIVELPVHAANEAEFEEAGELMVRVKLGAKVYTFSKTDWILGESKFGGILGVKQFCLPLLSTPSDLEQSILALESVPVEIFRKLKDGSEQPVSVEEIPVLRKKFPTAEEAKRLRKKILGIDTAE